MTQLSGTLGLIHLLMAADAELALVEEVVLYLGKAKAKFGDIAREAGVSRPTLYAAFEDKNAIMVATIHHVADQFLEGIKREIADKLTLEDRLILFIKTAIIEPYQLIQQSEDAADILSGHNDEGRKAIRETLEIKALFLKDVLSPFITKPMEDDILLNYCRTFVLASLGLKNTVANEEELQQNLAVLAELFLAHFT